MLAMGHPAALLALDQRRIATTVLEEDGLFATLQSLAHLIQQKGREGTVHHLTVLQVLDINNLDLGQFDALISLEEFHEAILARLRIVVGF